MTLEQGKQYTASLALGVLDRIAGNDVIAARFRALGFTDVAVVGSGASRKATGLWLEATREVALPDQVIGVSTT